VFLWQHVKYCWLCRHLFPSRGDPEERGGAKEETPVSGEEGVTLDLTVPSLTPSLFPILILGASHHTLLLLILTQRIYIPREIGHSIGRVPSIKYNFDVVHIVGGADIYVQARSIRTCSSAPQ